MIEKMTYANLSDYNQANEDYLIWGRIIPKYENEKWTYTEEVLSAPYLKRYENDDVDASYIENETKAVFFYYDNQRCIGQIKLLSNWNGYTLIEDIGVSKNARNKGIGTKLLEAAVQWAKQNRHTGLMLETQDVNLAACRFYARNNFVIGGVDTMLYSKFSTVKEKAIFWYYRF